MRGHTEVQYGTSSRYCWKIFSRMISATKNRSGCSLSTSYALTGRYIVPMHNLACECKLPYVGFRQWCLHAACACLGVQ